MPSPFPGMDPFIEDQEWDDFHVAWHVVVSELLGAALEPRYVARIERREYLKRFAGPQERRETYLLIREVPSLDIVTVIEALSPANKRTTSDGRAQYLKERQGILQSRANLVELDLLRGGQRLPVAGMPAGDYFAVVSRANDRTRMHLYAWTIRDRLPTLPIPLKAGEPEVPLDLQQVFTTVYDRARYHLSLRYTAKLSPPLDMADAAWLDELKLPKPPQ